MDDAQSDADKWVVLFTCGGDDTTPGDEEDLQQGQCECECQFRSRRPAPPSESEHAPMLLKSGGDAPADWEKCWWWSCWPC